MKNNYKYYFMCYLIQYRTKINLVPDRIENDRDASSIEHAIKLCQAQYLEFMPFCGLLHPLFQRDFRLYGNTCPYCLCGW